MDDDDRQAKRDQDAALELVGPQARQEQLVDHQAEQHDRHDRDGEGGPIEQAHHRQGEGHGEGAQHQELAVREIDDLHDAEDQRQADRDQGVEQTERDAVQRELQEIGAGDGHRHPGSANPGPAMVGGVRWFLIFVDT